jgi:hypothetical protein
MCEIQLETYRKGACMKKNYTEEQIIKILEEAVDGGLRDSIRRKA